jgi:hypothetical protein
VRQQRRLFAHDDRRLIRSPNSIQRSSGQHSQTVPRGTP